MAPCAHPGAGARGRRDCVRAAPVIPDDRHYPLEAYGGDAPPAPAWFREAIGQEPERRRIAVRGAEIETLSWGETGDPGVLLLHGAMANADWWRHIAPGLALRRRVTALSVSGMGRSDWRDRYSVDIHAAEALAAAEATGLFQADRAPTVAAHSFGGHVLIRLAALFGDRFATGVILDSMAGAPTNPPRHIVKTGQFASLEDALARFRLLPGQPAEPFILDWFGRQGLKRASSPTGGGYAWSFDPEFFVKFEPFEDGPDLARARCPLVFVRGERSGVCTPQVEGRQRQAAPTGTLFLTLADASHHLMADQPLRLGEMLSRLLNQTDLGADAPPLTSPHIPERNA